MAQVAPASGHADGRGGIQAGAVPQQAGGNLAGAAVFVPARQKIAPGKQAPHKARVHRRGKQRFQRGVIFFKGVIRQRQPVQGQSVFAAPVQGELFLEQGVYARAGVHLVPGQGAAVKEQGALAGIALIFAQRRGGILAGHGRGAGENDEKQFGVIDFPGFFQRVRQALVRAHDHLGLLHAGGGQKRLHARIEHGQAVARRAAHRAVNHRQDARHSRDAFQRPEDAAARQRFQTF